MDFWPEFLASSSGKEFVAGGFGGTAGIISGYPLDTLRIRQQTSKNCSSAFNILRQMVTSQGATSLYRGMATPLATVAFQNAMIFQTYAVLSRACDDSSVSSKDPPSYRGVVLGGMGTGGLQSFLLSPVELIKIRLQLQNNTASSKKSVTGPVELAKSIMKREGIRGLFRGLGMTILRDIPSHGFYFGTYEYMREWLHPGCRKSGKESLTTMLVSGGLAGVASWVGVYPIDVVKTRLQGQSVTSPKYSGFIDCFKKSVNEEGYLVLWRGVGTAVSRAFVVNGAVFAAYEITLRVLFNNGNMAMQESETI